MTLEELLNKLIDKGFNPFGGYKNSTHWETCNGVYGKWVVFGCDDNGEGDWKTQDYTLRELVSKESNLWQFVCKNGMTKKNTDLWVRCNEKTSKTYQDSYINQNYGYWLLESALKDESELEQFLLSNIKVDVENRG